MCPGYLILFFLVDGSHSVDFHGAVFCKQRVESLGLFVKPPHPQDVTTDGCRICPVGWESAGVSWLRLGGMP